MKLAVYAGSFDPITYGHQDLIERASLLFDKVIVGIGVNSAKKPLFTTEERLAMVGGFVEPYPNVTVEAFEGLLIDFCRRKGAAIIVRGLRAATDFDYELGIAQANRTQNQFIDTVFLPTKPEFAFVSSSVVKELCKHGGMVRDFVNHNVERALWAKFGLKDPYLKKAETEKKE